MNARPTLIPGPDHPILIEPNPSRIIVTVAGRTVADTHAALTLREADYAPALYIPREDVTVPMLERTEHHTYCPYKGDCSYYSIPAGGERAENAAWSYETPHTAMAAIAGYIAFYPGRVDNIEIQSS